MRFSFASITESCSSAEIRSVILFFPKVEKDWSVRKGSANNFNQNNAMSTNEFLECEVDEDIRIYLSKQSQVVRKLSCE